MVLEFHEIKERRSKLLGYDVKTSQVISHHFLQIQNCPPCPCNLPCIARGEKGVKCQPSIDNAPPQRLSMN